MAARDLVEDWVARSFDSGSEALDDLVARIADVLEGRTRIVLPVSDVEIAEPAPGSG